MRDFNAEEIRVATKNYKRRYAYRYIADARRPVDLECALREYATYFTTRESWRPRNGVATLITE